MSVGSTNPKRQMMINMMYLVLTALLALNVSAEVLKAFALVNRGLENTNKDYNMKNQQIYAAFKKQLEINEVKVKPFYDKAMLVKAEAEKVYAELDKIKADLAKEGGGWVAPDNMTVEKESDVEIGNDYFLNKKNASRVRKILTDYQNKIKELTGNKIDPRFNIGDPPPKDGVKKSWEEYYFEGVPLIACITEITKFKNDVHNAESETSKFLLGDIDANTFKIDDVVAIVNAEKSTILEGDEYSADIFLGAYSKTQMPEISVGGSQLKVEEGKASYKVRGSGVGDKTVKGNIRIKGPDGKPKDVPFDVKYNVFKSAAIVSATKMNVLYSGLDNPISVSVPGFTPEQIRANVTGGQATWKGDGKGNFICNPADRVRDVDINVQVQNGKTLQSFPKTHFRVRQVPNPIVYVGTKDGGPITRGEIPLINFITANLGASFAFEGLVYTVLSYTFAVAPKNAASGSLYTETIQGSRLSSAAKSRLTSCKGGDFIIVTDVRCKTPTGAIKTFNGTNLTVR